MRFRVPPPIRLHRTAAWALAIGVPVVVIAVELQLWPHLLIAPFILFFPAVLLVAYLGGLGPGLVVVALSAALVNAFILGKPPGGLASTSLLATALFLMVGFVLALAAASLRDGYAELHEGEERFRTLVETIPQLVFTARPDGWADFHAPQMVAYTGLAAADLAGTGWAAVVHPEDVARTLEAWQGAVASRAPATDELRLRRRDGAYRWFLVSVVPLRSSDGRVVKWFGSCTDIQAQKETEQAKTDAIAARDVFLSVASHELKTPVAAALLQVQQAQRRLSRTPPDVAGGLERAAATEASIERLGRLIEALLDVSRIATGHLALEHARYDLSAAVEQTAAQFADAARRGGSLLTVDATPGVEVHGDRLRVEQVVSNLLSNAVKYGGGRPIAVSLRRDGARAILRVTDQGIGIAPEDQARVFARFERASSARHYGGLGLGLWVARRIVEASGGSIAVESHPGVGSTFTVVLPACDGLPGSAAVGGSLA